MLFRSYINEGEVFNISIIGTMERIGCTTQGVATYLYLKSQGLKAVVVDKCDTISLFTQHLKDIITIDEYGHFYIHDVRFDENEQTPQSTQVNIFDIGTKVNEHMSDILSSDLVILVGGVKPKEVFSLLHTLQNLTEIQTERIITLLSFGTEKDLVEASENLPTKCFLAPYRPDPFSTDEIHLYKDILHEKLQELIGDE